MTNPYITLVLELDSKLILLCVTNLKYVSPWQLIVKTSSSILALYIPYDIQVASSEDLFCHGQCPPKIGTEEGERGEEREGQAMHAC